MSIRPALLILFVAVLAIPYASATATILAGPEHERTKVYSPGDVYEYNWRVDGAEYLDVELKSAFGDNAVLYDADPGGGPRNIRFVITPPDDLEPGLYRTHLRVSEGSPGGLLSARASVRTTINVIVRSPTPRVSAGIEVGDVAEGKAATALLTLVSWSHVATEDVHADVVIENPDGDDITTTLDPVTVEAGDTKKLELILPTEQLQAGRYKAVATFFNTGEGGTESNYGDFRVGGLSVNLISFTQRLSVGAINRFTFFIGSNWNQPLDDVSGIVELAGVSDKTASVVIEPFGEEKLKAFLDLSEVTIDGTEEFEGTIKVVAREGINEREISVFPITVTLAEEELPTTNIKPEELQEPGIFTISIPVNTLTILYALVFVLVIINIILLFRQRKKE